MATTEQQDILDQLADAAADLVVLMPARATIERDQAAAGPYGGTRTVGTVVAADVPCRWKRLSGSQATETTQYSVALPAGTDLRTGDRVRVDHLVLVVAAVLGGSYAVQTKALCAVAVA
ncbi:hypothetical protein [Blastococcus mobilis]|uniref:Uncharacterized protein n=1 Tax=Blastococcus mobilis TaxID=1938746 RepID=A0A238VWG6_9ACTN|nr:hypothetical protein [Blastococcus mobilis]SNR38650.1 hypothetical protein SAMN06272737_105108 [Blastococcus mobilis]